MLWYQPPLAEAARQALGLGLPSVLSGSIMMPEAGAWHCTPFHDALSLTSPPCCYLHACCVGVGLLFVGLRLPHEARHAAF